MKRLMILCLGFIPFISISQGPQEYHLAENYSGTNSQNMLKIDISQKRSLSVEKEAENDLTFTLTEFEDYISKNLLSIRDELLSATDPNIYDGMHTFTKDGRTVFFSVNRKIKKNKEINENDAKTKSSVNLHLFKATVNEKGEWVNLEMLPFNHESFSTGQPTLNKENTKLYFVSDGPGSLGRTDIFSVELFRDGTYGKPENLGPKINSTGREIFPFIDVENVLYYSSDQLNEKGDLDVFAAKIFDNTVSKPILLSVSVFTEKDDLSSVKKAGKGTDEIYAFASTQPLFFDCEQKVLGKVRNADTMVSLSNVRLDLLDQDNKKLITLQSNETDGTFSFDQFCNTNYKLKAYLEGYLTEEINIHTVNDLGANTQEIVMDLREVPSTEIKNVPEIPVVLSINVDPSAQTYDFSSGEKVFSVQIGAFQENAKTEQFNGINNFFNHLYTDGFNRFFSGVFQNYSEALEHMRTLNQLGYNDAFIVGLQGETHTVIPTRESKKD
ncbi:SPOR domain-containing protein [Namhaeicola litoreus]|uniref:SPOR domain-containing protein n=1 Tax=Namhaeicola litoreus TaxID=1052145 RepID=A0ABW3Y031_9FLAO